MIISGRPKKSERYFYDYFYKSSPLTNKLCHLFLDINFLINSPNIEQKNIKSWCLKTTTISFNFTFRKHTPCAIVKMISAMGFTGIIRFFYYIDANFIDSHPKFFNIQRKTKQIDTVMCHSNSHSPVLPTAMLAVLLNFFYFYEL